jgi:hypothetical protein
MVPNTPHVGQQVSARADQAAQCGAAVKAGLAPAQPAAALPDRQPPSADAAVHGALRACDVGDASCAYNYTDVGVPPEQTPIRTGDTLRNPEWTENRNYNYALTRFT